VTCAGKDPAVAKAGFLAQLAEQGAILLEPKYLGKDKLHQVMCAEGHVTNRRPSKVRRGSICRVCAGRDSEASEVAFRARLAERNATLLETEWLGCDTPHRVICWKGHSCAPRPSSILKGQGICRACAGRDPKASEAAFRARLAELDAVLLEPAWLGVAKRHRVRCSRGHDCAPRPNSVLSGQGVCRTCAGKTWDALYVVVDDVADVLKFGITSGNPRPRLAAHRSVGFDRIVRIYTDLPDGVAYQLERDLIAALREAGEVPVRGREFFHGRVQPLVVRLIDTRLACRSLDQINRDNAGNPEPFGQ
jgi:hypothetical protein